MIRNAASSQEERTEALKIIDNWRSAHAYPLHVFYMNLRGKAKLRNDILVVERLKRLESIVGKLQRENGMQLYRMQDLGGCRMVLPTLDEVYEFSGKETTISKPLNPLDIVPCTSFIDSELTRQKKKSIINTLC